MGEASSATKVTTAAGFSVTLNTSGAESLLNQAQQLYHAQNYEQAIRTAGAAVQCLNLALGLPEVCGLPVAAVAP